MHTDNDNWIENEIDDFLENELGRPARDIKVQCRDGFVTLSGFVDTLAEKNAAGELASRLKGVKSIENCLTISTDGTFEDKEAEAEVIKKLKGDPDINQVSSKVVKGVAVLEGKVRTLKKKNLAIHKASEAIGIKDIVSHIEIESLGRFDDASINNKIQQQFVDNGMTHNDIRVAVENGSIQLSGFVNTYHDMEAALEIVEDVEGVRNIKNFLKVRGH